MTKGVIRKYVQIGECTINVPTTIKRWDKHWFISQWDDEYTLCHHCPTAENFSMTDFRARISNKQAKKLIVELDLIPKQSPFKSGKTWLKQEEH